MDTFLVYRRTTRAQPQSVGLKMSGLAEPGASLVSETLDALFKLKVDGSILQVNIFPRGRRGCRAHCRLRCALLKRSMKQHRLITRRSCLLLNDQLFNIKRIRYLLVG